MNYRYMRGNFDCTIFVLSSDFYQPILKIWDYYHQKNWKCPYNVITVCNNSPYDSKNNQFLDYSNRKIECLNTEIPWDENASHFKPMVLHGLSRITTKYVLFMVEDQIIVNRVENNNIYHALNFMERNDITKLRCLSMPEPDEPLIGNPEGPINNDNFGMISKNNEYRNSLQAAIWNKDRLTELLKSKDEDFSGWVLETDKEFRDYSKKWNYVACRQGKGGTLITRNEGQTDSPLVQYVELIRWGKLDAIYYDFFMDMFKKDNININTEEYERFGGNLTKEQLPQ